MARLNWSERSVNDLRSIGEYIANDSPKYARITVKSIREKARLLINFPGLGRVVPETDDKKIREIIYGSYRIIYIVSFEKVFIVTVHHSAKQLSTEEINKYLNDD